MRAPVFAKRVARVKSDKSVRRSTHPIDAPPYIMIRIGGPSPPAALFVTPPRQSLAAVTNTRLPPAPLPRTETFHGTSLPARYAAQSCGAPPRNAPVLDHPQIVATDKKRHLHRSRHCPKTSIF